MNRRASEAIRTDLEADASLRGVRGEVDHDQLRRVAVAPRPGEQALARRVVGPARRLEQPPAPALHAPRADHGQQPSVPGVEVAVCGLLRSAGQEDRRSDATALELSLVPQRGPGQRGDGDRRRPLGVHTEARRDAGLVVVLQEAQQLRLVAQVGAQVLADGASVQGQRGGRRAACRSRSRSLAAAAPTPGPSTPPRSSTVSGCPARRAPITSGQNSAPGSGPTRHPQVRREDAG